MRREAAAAINGNVIDECNRETLHIECGDQRPACLRVDKGW